MRAEQIEVITYSGHRGAERPKAFFLHGEKIEVVDILERWIEEGFEDRVRKRFFKVKGSDGYTHVLYHDENTQEWFHK